MGWPSAAQTGTTNGVGFKTLPTDLRTVAWPTISLTSLDLPPDSMIQKTTCVPPIMPVEREHSGRRR